MAEILKAGSPKVVKKESFLAMMNAVTILDTAREQGRRLIEAAKAQSEQALAAAREAGEAEGLRRYLDESAKLDASIHAFYAKSEPDMVRLAMAVARKLLGGELEARPEAVACIVRDALAGIRQARRVTITVHSSQAAALRTQLHTLELAASCEVQVTAREDLDPAGCLIDSDFGIIDARLETRLATLERALLRPARTA
jgi:type III secretion protein L